MRLARTQGGDPETWAETRRRVSHAEQLLHGSVEYDPRFVTAPPVVLPPLEERTRAFSEVTDELARIEQAARAALRTVEAADLEWRGGRLVSPTGGHPREFYRDLVEALLQAFGDRADAETRNKMATELGPFFPDRWVDPRPSGKLANTIKNIRRR